MHQHMSPTRKVFLILGLVVFSALVTIVVLLRKPSRPALTFTFSHYTNSSAWIRTAVFSATNVSSERMTVAFWMIGRRDHSEGPMRYSPGQSPFTLPPHDSGVFVIDAPDSSNGWSLMVGYGGDGVGSRFRRWFAPRYGGVSFYSSIPDKLKVSPFDFTGSEWIEK